jgi:hypothetical protein
LLAAIVIAKRAIVSAALFPPGRRTACFRRVSELLIQDSNQRRRRRLHETGDLVKKFSRLV